MVCTHPAGAQAGVDAPVRPELHGDGQRELLRDGDQHLVEERGALFGDFRCGGVFVFVGVYSIMVGGWVSFLGGVRIEKT